MTCHLYGANAKRIQSYIFTTNKLKEIGGASELVQAICTDCFDDFVKRHNLTGSVQPIIQAAGNIYAVVTDEEAVKILVLRFLREAMEFAPGLPMVQAVIPIDGAMPTKTEVDKLNQKLHEAQPASSPYKDWSVTLKTPQDGRPACGVQKEGRDRGKLLNPESQAKLKYDPKHTKSLRSKFSYCRFPEDNSQLGDPENEIAVIHADGNAIGQALMRLDSGDPAKYGEKWQCFSQTLEEVTKQAANEAFQKYFSREKGPHSEEEPAPHFRPIILGGDDLTVLCSAKHALEFTAEYLELFKKKVDEANSDKAHPDILGNLTACAGVAFIKANYPFHYGVQFAEQLCGQAKKVAKQNLAAGAPVPSCLMFARELGSFVETSFEAFAKRELQTGEVTQEFGPYALSDNEKMPIIGDLLNLARLLASKPGSPLRNGLRHILKELHVDKAAADFLADRMEEVAAEDAMAKLKNALVPLTRHKSEEQLRKLLYQEKKSPIADALLATKFVE